jgi:hypothetical protein
MLLTVRGLPVWLLSTITSRTNRSRVHQNGGPDAYGGAVR